ncbi:Uncharacterized protein TCM_030689 [Theobroma cacao]|uniref:Uncharacterized protein n=1 Tax=Theobroma cacao TaxID=3641 RepID=A0A061F4Y2_THECC|nr:Uncharacterized protein TCM_030689 [Theobroma cacao]
MISQIMAYGGDPNLTPQWALNALCKRVYAYMGIPLQSSNISSALATFRMLEEPIYNLPDTISTTVIRLKDP